MVDAKWMGIQGMAKGDAGLFQSSGRETYSARQEGAQRLGIGEAWAITVDRMMRRTTCPQCRRKLGEGERIHPECRDAYAEACAAKAERKAAKAIKTAAKEDRAETKRRKEKLKTRSDYLKEAQRAFNAFVRERDRAAGYPCISSGRPLDWSGNKVDSGHYRSTGAAPQLRFNLDNAHAQSKHDNQFLAGNTVDYRVRLIERIGLERVEALESDNAPRKFTAGELIEIRDTYRAKANELARARR